MIEGLLRCCTDAEVESNYVDPHVASVVGVLSELLNFLLLPRRESIPPLACAGLTTRRPAGPRSAAR